jgi:DMSO/TMAO reductase YedYZ molybdopterin-dependent catalytic subunit
MVVRARFFFRFFIWAIAVIVAVGGLGLAVGCSSDADGAGGGNGGEGAIEVIGPEGTKAYTVDDLKEMPATEGYWGIKSSTGRITPPLPTKGVSLEDLFAEVGGLPDGMAVAIIAKDGYEMTASVEQIRAGDFITYDPVTGEEVTVDGPLTAIVAYEWDGKPFDPQSDGPLRMAIVSPEQNQVTDGHWSVKWTNKVEARSIVQDWVLTLKGHLTEEIDRATFESGAAEGCHGVNWTDAEGNVWNGIPLYLLVGRVDDDNVHEGPAYNRDLAQAGYQVRLVTADGESVEVSSNTMYYNKELILAYKLNGDTLPEEYWPLRLVGEGEGIGEAEMLGQITEIEALLPAE